MGNCPTMRRGWAYRRRRTPRARDLVVATSGAERASVWWVDPQQTAIRISSNSISNPLIPRLKRTYARVAPAIPCARYVNDRA